VNKVNSLAETIRYFKNCTNVTRSNMFNVHNIELSGEHITRWCMVFLTVGIIDSSELKFVLECVL